ncbi:MAG: transporter [Gammaproteobacteria bacterium]|nr:transporter [Gammaproteobacteria bacterium]
MKSHVLLLINLSAMIFISEHALADSRASVSIGYEQTSGNYGLTNETNSTTVQLSMKYMSDAWSYKLSAPLISVTGDGSVIPSGGGGGMGGFGGTTGSAITTETGLGDVSAGIAYSILPENSFMYYELSAGVKLGAASVENNLGTGENDYSMSLYSSYEKNPVKPFLSIGYTLVGDTDTINFNDVFFATAGFNYQVNAKTSVSLSYDYTQATIDGDDDAQILGLGIGRVFNDNWFSNIYLLNGLSDSVADSGIGFSLTNSF